MNEIHIASCVAFARPEAAESIQRAIRATGLAEVPRRDERGRMVVLIERESAEQVLDVMDAIRALPDVITIHLAYQHAEPASDMEQLQ